MGAGEVQPCQNSVMLLAQRVLVGEPCARPTRPRKSGLPARPRRPEGSRERKSRRSSARRTRPSTCRRPWPLRACRRAVPFALREPLRVRRASRPGRTRPCSTSRATDLGGRSPEASTQLEQMLGPDARRRRLRRRSSRGAPHCRRFQQGDRGPRRRRVEALGWGSALGTTRNVPCSGKADAPVEVQSVTRGGEQSSAKCFRHGGFSSVFGESFGTCAGGANPSGRTLQPGLRGNGSGERVEDTARERAADRVENTRIPASYCSESGPVDRLAPAP